jgi:MarR family transcriptional regulator, 2-MHQ and catechol-resistance regulon repressor
MAPVGTHHQGPADEVRALDAYIKLVRATDSLTERTHRHLAEVDLTISQFGVLEVLLHLGPMCQKDLGEKLLKSGGNITVVVRNLEKRGLVRRTRHAENRRFVTVELTASGRALIKKVFPRHVEALVREMRVLPAADLETLGRLLKRLGTGG